MPPSQIKCSPGNSRVSPPSPPVSLLGACCWHTDSGVGSPRARSDGGCRRLFEQASVFMYLITSAAGRMCFHAVSVKQRLISGAAFPSLPPLLPAKLPLKFRRRLTAPRGMQPAPLVQTSASPAAPGDPRTPCPHPNPQRQPKPVAPAPRRGLWGQGETTGQGRRRAHPRCDHHTGILAMASVSPTEGLHRCLWGGSSADIPPMLCSLPPVGLTTSAFKKKPLQGSQGLGH